jgi:hypothetical protein
MLRTITASTSTLFALLALCACTTTSEPVRTGKNTYLLTVKGCDGALLFGASCATSGIKAANNFCEKKGLVATVSGTNESGQSGLPQHGTVQFYCTDEDSQQDSVLRPDNGIVTVQRR